MSYYRIKTQKGFKMTYTELKNLIAFRGDITVRDAARIMAVRKDQNQDKTKGEKRMLSRVQAQLDKIESMHYEGVNADALREMDFQELRDLIEEAVERIDQIKDILEESK